MSCSAASWRIVADGAICGLGGRKIASRWWSAHQEGKVPPEAVQSRSSLGVIRCWRRLSVLAESLVLRGEVADRCAGLGERAVTSGVDGGGWFGGA